MVIIQLQEKLKQFEERLAEERHNRLEERKRQRKEERRITYYREKEEEEQRRAEEKMLKGDYLDRDWGCAARWIIGLLSTALLRKRESGAKAISCFTAANEFSGADNLTWFSAVCYL